MACRDCKYFVAYFDGDTYGCHRYPPQVVVRTHDRLEACFPKVRPYEHCGEHKPATQPKQGESND